MYMFFVVVLTKQGKLMDAHVRARSRAEALDKFIAVHNLERQVADYRVAVTQVQGNYE